MDKSKEKESEGKVVSTERVVQCPSSKTVFMVKLPDSCLNALLKRPGSIKLTLDKHNAGTINIQSGSSYSWNAQPCSNTDVVIMDKKNGYSFSPINHKIAVAADEQASFASTKQKAEQLQTSKGTQAPKKVNDKRIDYKVNKLLENRRKGEAETLNAGTTPPQIQLEHTGEITLAQRVIHQLALKPMSRGTIIDRIQKEMGGREPPSAQMDNVLAQVAEQSGNGQYKLGPDKWAEVRADSWPHYGALDRQVATDNARSQMKRRKKELKMAAQTAANAGDTSEASNMLRASTKRALVTGKSSNRKRAPPESPPEPASPQKRLSPAPPKEKEPSPPPPPQNANDINMEMPSLPDFASLWPHCGSRADYDRYRATFDRDYPVYLNAYKEIKRVSDIFTKLGAKLEEQPPGSSKHKEVERDIQQQFAHFTKDAEFMRIRQLHCELRAKLQVLKERIQHYERQQKMALQTCQQDAESDGENNAPAESGPSTANDDMFEL